MQPAVMSAGLSIEVRAGAAVSASWRWAESAGEIGDGFGDGYQLFVVAARPISWMPNGTRSVSMPAGMTIMGQPLAWDSSIDVLAAHPESRSILAVEAKDFEIARTPAEIANELEKLFSGKKGKKSTIELHSKRIGWLRQHLHEVVLSIGAEGGPARWRVIGAVVTSDPLITPLVSSSTLPVIPFDDLTLAALDLTPPSARRSPKHKRRRKRRQPPLARRFEAP
jgi:hypothetical protein